MKFRYGAGAFSAALAALSFLLASAAGPTTPDPGFHAPSGSPSLSTPAGSGEWASSWQYRIKITIDPDSLPEGEDLHGFPLLLSLNEFNAPGVWIHAKSDGSDIAITKQDGVTPLEREVVSYDSQSRRAEIWVGADTLSRASNALYLYYGNPDTTISQANGAVWDSSYIAVYHFSENPGAGGLRDYSPRQNDALPMGGWTDADTSSTIGQAWRFNGTSHWIDGDAIQSTDSTFTVSAWLGLDRQVSGHACFAFQAEEGFWHLSALRNDVYPYPDLYTAYSNIGWNPLHPDTLPHHFVWSLDGVADTARFYFDGMEQTLRMHWVPNPPYKAYTGERIMGNVGIVGPCWPSVLDLFDGSADEFRIYEGIRSPAWIATEYRSQRERAGILSFAPEEPTAILLSGLEATYEDTGVVLRWEAIPGAFDALYVERKASDGSDVDYSRLNESDPVPPRGPWVFVDRAVEAGADYAYRVAGRTLSGETLFFGPVMISVPPFGEPSLWLDGRNPAPRSGTRLTLRIPRAGHAALVIYDGSGREVRSVLDQQVPSGTRSLEWDGLDADGRRVPGGVYLARLSWNGKTAATKLVVLR